MLLDAQYSSETKEVYFTAYVRPIKSRFSNKTYSVLKKRGTILITTLISN